MKSAATNTREFRNFLLMSQFEARGIGARIRMARKEAGLTQEQLAATASFSARSLQDYEAGVTVPWQHFRELSAVLQKSLPWLMHGEEAEDEVLRRLAQVEDELRNLRTVAATEEQVERAVRTVQAALDRIEEAIRGSANPSTRPVASDR